MNKNSIITSFHCTYNSLFLFKLTYITLKKNEIIVNKEVSPYFPRHFHLNIYFSDTLF